MTRLRLDARVSLALGIVVGLLFAGLVVPLGFGSDPEVIAGGPVTFAGPDLSTPGDPTADDGTPGSTDPGVVAKRGGAGSIDEGEGGATPGSVGPGAEDVAAHKGGATDVGVTNDTIKVGILVLDPDSAAGFASGAFADERAVWTALFADMLDTPIHGRRIEPVYAEYDGLDNDQKNAMCRRLTEDEKVFAVLNNAGFSQTPQLCIAKEHDTPFVYGQGISEYFLNQAPRRMFSVSPTMARGNRDLVRSLVADGVLQGKKVGVIDSEFDGDYQDSQAVLQVLEELDVPVTAYATFSSDLDVGASQVPVIVSEFRSKDVEIVISTAVALYTGLMAQQGNLQGWDPTWWVNDEGLNTTDTGSQVHPSTMIGRGYTAWRLHEERADIAEPALDADCRDRYQRNSGQNLDRGEGTYEGVLQTCALVSAFTTAIDRAGPTLTRDGFGAAWYGLGTLELPFYGGSIAGVSRPDLADRVRPISFDGSCTCWEPVGAFRDMR